MPDASTQNTGNVNLTDASVRVGEQANVILGHGNTQMVYHGDVVHGNQTIIQQIVQAAVEKLTGSPYKFLSSYGLEDRDIFYGRDAVVEEIAGRVPQHKVVIVNGASGAGKTSLVNAGLLPRLAEHGYTFINVREYSRDPLTQVRSYLKGEGLIDVPDGASLRNVLAAFQAKQKTKLVVVFDQFERFLVNVPVAEREGFIHALEACTATFSGAVMNFVFVLREDFLGQMLREVEEVIPDFGMEAYRYNLKLLGMKEAREAILRPLERIAAKIDYDDAFVDQVLLPALDRESEERGISPPHLQIVCHRLFQEAHRQARQKNGRLVVIGAALSEKLGGAEGILNTYLDRTVEEIAGDAEHVAVVRSMLKAMIETTGTRKFVSLEDLGGALPDVNEQEIAKLLDRLATRWVIERRTPQYSLAHEYMVGRVGSWFDERELQRRKARELLVRGLDAWKTWAEKPLLGAGPVRHIRAWLMTSELTAEAEAFLAASEADVLKQQQAAEERRRQQERMETLRREAEVRQRALDVSRQTRDGLYLKLLSEVAFFSLKDTLGHDALAGAIEAEPGAWHTLVREKEHIFAAARVYGQGRLLAVGHDSVLFYHDHNDQALFLEMALMWLRGDRPPRLLVSRGHGEAAWRYHSPEQGKWLWAKLRDWGYQTEDVYDLTEAATLDGGALLLVANAWEAFSDAERAIVQAFVEDGGGLLGVGSGWSFRDYAPLASGAADPLAVYPMNTLMAPFGLRWNEGLIGFRDGAKAPRAAFVSAQFSPDGERLVTVSTAGAVHVWNAENGDPLATLETTSVVVQTAQFSPDGRRIVTVSTDGMVHVWRADDGAFLATLSS